MLALLGCSGCAVVTWYPCHQATVSASLGGGVSVLGSVLSGHGASILEGGDGGYVNKEVNTNDTLDILEKRPCCGHSHVYFFFFFLN